MSKYILEIIYHYSTALTSWSWTKLYGDRNKKMKTIPDTIDSIKKKIRELQVLSLYYREGIVGAWVGLLLGIIIGMLIWPTVHYLMT